MNQLLDGSPVLLPSQTQLQQFIDERVDAKIKDCQEEYDLMNVDQAAEFLGISKGRLYLKTSKKQIPFSKPPGTRKLWFSKTQLEDWIKSYGG